MALVDVTKACLDSIGQISEHIEGSILYLDAGSSESFQFMGAFSVLLNLGVRSICSLEKMCSLDVVAHSAYPDSSLGPYAFHEYESLLVQYYDELVKKCVTKSKWPESSNLKDNLISEDEGWSELTSVEEDIHVEASPSRRDYYKDNLIDHTEDVGQKLVVSVHHFPMILCPFSPRVFALPSEGSIAEAYLS